MKSKPGENLNNPKQWGKIINIFEDGIYITDSHGLTLKVNKAYENITGINASDVVGKYMRDIVKEGLLSVSITQQVIDSGKEVLANQKTKTGKWVVLKGTPIFDEGKNISLVVTFVRDITVLNHIQDELDRFRNIANQYKRELIELSNTKSYIAESKGFQHAILIAKKVANVDSTVLILGESGTGKEIIARTIHEYSNRAKNMFVKINCGAIPENLLESELFGYEGGAFTGANKSGHIGMFEMADKGSIFLDEIGDMPLILQVKLLRVLQEKKITRIGSSKLIDIDVRIIAATHQNLEHMVNEGKFRKDLYYRLNVVQIKSPPLRERKEEIPALIDFFVSKINQKYGFEKKISSGIIKELIDYDWPGNVRELENIIERILVTSQNDEILSKDIELYWKTDIVSQESEISVSKIMPLKEAFDKVERQLILEASKKYKTTYQIAEALQISQPSAFRKLKKYKNEE